MAWEFHGYEHDKIQVKDENNDIKCIDVPIIDTWREMEKLVKDGLVHSIGKSSPVTLQNSRANFFICVWKGVSNFTIPMLEELLEKAEIPPAMNQVTYYWKTKLESKAYRYGYIDWNPSQLTSGRDGWVGQEA